MAWSADPCNKYTNRKGGTRDDIHRTRTPLLMGIPVTQCVMLFGGQFDPLLTLLAENFVGENLLRPRVCFQKSPPFRFSSSHCGFRCSNRRSNGGSVVKIIVTKYSRTPEERFTGECLDEG